MGPVLIFLAVIAVIVVWWAVYHRIGSKPWTEIGWAGAACGDDAPRAPPAKIGLGVFLAVVGALFALLTSAYFMRMELSDWQALPVPRVLWFNTGVLVLSSLALHIAVVAVRRDQIDTAKFGLAIGGLTALVFLAGQLVAWRELSASGYLLDSNPANSFFYLLTAIHGLHIAGGLVALGRTMARAWAGVSREKLRLSIELCAMYWHFLLFIWLGVFVLIAGWAADFIDVCRQLLA